MLCDPGRGLDLSGVEGWNGEKGALNLVFGNQNGRCEQMTPDRPVCGSRQESRIPVPKDTQPTGTMFHIRINKRTVQNPFPVSPGQV